MPAFKPMDPDVIRKLLEDPQNRDLLTPLARQEQALFRNSPCPVCGGAEHTELLNASRPFSPGSPLPNKILKCLQCGTEYDPFTGLVTKAMALPTDESE